MRLRGILSRTEWLSSAGWRSRKSLVSMNCATVHGRDRCGQRAGVTDGKMILHVVTVRQNREGADPCRAARSSQRSSRLLRGIHASHTINRKRVGGASTGGRLALRNGLTATASTQLLALRGGRLPGLLGEPARNRKVQAGHGGSVHPPPRGSSTCGHWSPKANTATV